MNASSLVWVKQTSWIKQIECISCDWQMNTAPVCDENHRPTEYVIGSRHACAFLNSWDSDFVFLGTLSCNSNEIKASAGKFSPDSLHITRMTLLSLWRYNPSAHRQTCARLNACLHTCIRNHPHRNTSLLTALTEWAPAVHYLSPCSLFRIQLADKAWSCPVLLGCLIPASRTPNLGVHFNSISHLPAARMS